ncbi:DUF7003 family protein [Chitinophaga arvensicola]|uniref:Uncharacterized protein n=1 Tax=Chitinophaga arvensicola TaxID=29529 RepID=A0A1I0RTU3_9BACT|nr:hypothetical protein [Chitinophaga arvensicola]SEW44832.1 hypothetical protein SAMN04488122_3382 [Chitinophaga arvensicola]
MNNKYTESEILSHFDPNLNIEENKYYPVIAENDIRYHFWLDLEHGYCETAGSRIHLYADDERWAVVAEKSGYQNRGFRAEIELYYFGNCIDYPVSAYPERNYVSNLNSIVLITEEEWERICNTEGEDMEQFEMISPDAQYVMIRDVKIPIEQDVTRYRNLGIHSRQEDNPRELISFEDLLRYYHDTTPGVLSSTEAEIRQHIPADLRKLMTIDHFHFSSVYSDDHHPAREELYQLITKILITKDTSLWQPTLPSNNHWSNWESGTL